MRGAAQRPLQAAVDPLNDVAFVLLQDSLLDVSVHLLVHEVPQLGQIVIWGEKQKKKIPDD